MPGKRLLLTGQPGVGKTTLVKNICDVLKNKHVIPVSGFYTEEIREGRQRIGFDVVTLTGERSSLARKSDHVSMEMQRRCPSVGQYFVDLPSFEKLALPSITVDQCNKNVLIIDEIGKMELFSKSFTAHVRRLFNEHNGSILATIPIARGKSLALVTEIAARSDTKIITVTRENRDHLMDELLTELLE